MVEIKFIDVIGFRTEDPRFPTANLLKGQKWLCKKKWGNHVNDVTLRLEKVFVINAVDIGNSGSAFITLEVSRMGLQRFETLLPSTSLLSAEDCKTKENWSSVKMFTQEDFNPFVREEKWDIIRIVCMQPFLGDVQFGLSFFRAFSNLNTVVEQVDLDIGSPSRSFWTRHPESFSIAVAQPMSRSETLVEKVKSCILPSHLEGSPVGKKQDSSNSDQSDTIKNHINLSPNSNDVTPKKTTSLAEKKAKFIKRIHSGTPSTSNSTSKTTLEEDKSFDKNSMKVKNFDNLQSPNASKAFQKSCPEVVTLMESDSDSDSTVILPYQSFSEHIHTAEIHSPRPLGSPHSFLSSPSVRKRRKKTSDDSDTDTVLLVPSSPDSISSQVTDVLLPESDVKPGSSLQTVQCPLCFEEFVRTEIEEHAANCCLLEEQGYIDSCPICGKYFPPNVLLQHADLCSERKLLTEEN